MRKNLEAIAFKAVRGLAADKGTAAFAASLELPHLIRAHGLSATLNYALSKSSSTCMDVVASHFLSALHDACPIDGEDVKSRAESLVTETHRRYRIHSRLSLRIADCWAMAARAMLEPDGNGAGTGTRGTEGDGNAS